MAILVGVTLVLIFCKSNSKLCRRVITPGQYGANVRNVAGVHGHYLVSGFLKCLFLGKMK